MVINNEINQFSSAGDTHIETKLPSTDVYSLKHEYETIKKYMNEKLKNGQNWLVIIIKLIYFKCYNYQFSKLSIFYMRIANCLGY